jgi:methyl-accepting chemotaxis protein
MRGFLISGKDSLLEPYKKWASEYDRVIEDLEDSVSNPERAAMVHNAQLTLKSWKTNIADKYIAQRMELDSSNSKEVLNIMSDIVAKQEGKAYFDKFRDQMEAFIAVEYKLLEERDKSAVAVTEKTNITIIGGTLAAIFLAIIISFILLKSIIQPIGQLKKAALKISQGDVDVKIDIQSSDELGELANSFRIMTTYIQESSQIAHSIERGELDIDIKQRSDKDLLSESFKGMIDSLKESAQIAHSIGEGDLDVVIKKRSENDVLGIALENMTVNLKKIMSELGESTAVLNSAAGEILATTSQIAAGATQTSSAIAQTTSSVEEIKQTAKLTSEKAFHTAESTKKAVVISDNGNQSLDKNMEGLAQIKEKMDSIAANIIRLSEQSQMIGNIVSTVEDIASQSNLLAVNASIEAVKAGEHGKGFSVVAQELKNLANQSKQGTGDVQKILTDIQHSTNSLVMVAEQGGKAVDDGVKQARDAKESMQLLRQSVTEAAQSGTLIAASSEQEMAGMDQIAGAMISIKAATMQNVESIRQVESSAKGLSILSQKLKSLMDQYSFNGTGR